MPKPPEFNIRQKRACSAIIQRILDYSVGEELRYHLPSTAEAEREGVPSSVTAQEVLLKSLDTVKIIKLGKPVYKWGENPSPTRRLGLIPIGTEPLYYEIIELNQGLASKLLGDAPDKTNTEPSSKSVSDKSSKVTFRGGIIRQGSANHAFRSQEMRALISYLWNGRARLDSQGNSLKEAAATPRSVVMAELTISESRLSGLVGSFNQMMRLKGIRLSIRMPDRVYLEAID